MEHDDVVRRAIEVVEGTDERAVVSAWLGSLTNRDLVARAAFGCYVVLRHLSEHEHTPSIFAGRQCGVCGLPDRDIALADPAVPGYPTGIDYALPVLVAHRAGPPVTEDDHDRLRRLMDGVRALPPTAGLADLSRVAQGIVASNKPERAYLLETLGYAGILCPTGQRHYSTQFVARDFASSQYPARKSDWQYPVRFWTGADGVKEDMVARYFTS
jgi:hypothetical protein